MGIGQAWAQPPCTISSVLPAGCPQPFLALNASNQEVQSFCVGQPVHFVPCASRALDATQAVYYGVLPGSGTTYNQTGQNCQPPNTAPYTYTPTAAEVGMVTVSELSTEPPPYGSRYNIRTFRVYGTPSPTFTIAPCPTGNVSVTVTDATYDSYTVQVGAATLPITRNVALTVPAPTGSTTVTVTGHYTALGTCTGSASQTITNIAAPVAAQFTSLALQAPLPGGTATLTLGGLLTGYRYTLQFQPTAGGPFTDVPSVTITPGSTTTLTLPGALAGRYRIFSDDACNTSPLASAAIGTLSLTGASANNRNQLLLTDAGAPGTSYSVTRNGSAIPTTPIAGGLEDADVQCGTTYRYVVTATQPGGTGQAISNEVSITTVSALPPAQPRLVASFNAADVVELTPLLATTPLAAGSSLLYSRTAGSRTDNFNPVTNARILRDSTIALADLLANPACYAVRLSDVCRNTSPASNPACPALLSARPADPDGSTIALTWTSFAGPDPAQPATYTLQRLAADGTVLPGSVVVTGNAYTDLAPPTDRQVARYRLQISGAGLPAGTFSYSNRATVTRRLTVTIPSAFTPNNDGLNDVLEVKGKYLSNYTFVVVDRNGQEVFRGTQRSEAWDGTIKGHAPVLGAYVWRFQQNNEDGEPYSATGTVTILK
ncbi:T9SS type B sorting domain-containing protein [Hymenobacter daeguensis]